MHFEIANGGAAPAGQSAQGAFVAASQPQPKTLGQTAGSILGGFADYGRPSEDSAKRLAELSEQAAQANTSMLTEDDQRQAQALKSILSRRSPAYA